MTDIGKHTGRPRKHATPDQRTAAYMRSAAGKGLVRVSVMVPAGRAGDVRELAAAMRTSSKRARSLGKATEAPRARGWNDVDDATISRVWREGGTSEEATAGVGRSVEEIAKRLVALEEAGTVPEVIKEFAARSRADASALQRKTRRILEKE